MKLNPIYAKEEEKTNVRNILGFYTNVVVINRAVTAC